MLTEGVQSPAPARVAADRADSHPEQTRWSAWFPVALVLLAGAVAAAPLLLAALHAARGAGLIYHRGDQALIAMDTDGTAHVDQALGVYSRYGWRHPGPGWFGLLAIPFTVGGGSGRALLTANILVHAAMAAALVAALADRARPARAPLAALLVLGYVWLLPDDSFVQVWNPYALLLPAALFLVLAARAMSGELAALAAAVLVGGYLVQVHVGAALLVVVTGGVLAAVLLVRVLLARRAGARPPLRVGGRSGAGLTAAAALGAVALWAAPVLQQLRAAPGQGNLSLIVEFFRSGGDGTQQPDGHPFGEAVVAVGKLATVLFHGTGFGQFAGFEIGTETGRGGAVAAVALILAGGVLLTLAGRRLHAPLAGWLGITTLAGTAAAVLSVQTVIGPVYWFVIIWITALPLLVALGLADLLAALPWRCPQPYLPALTALVLAGFAAALLVPGQKDRSDRVESSPDVAALSQLVLPALGRPGAVEVDIDASWLACAGLVRQLELAGWQVTVNPQWIYVFGERYLGTPPGAVHVHVDDPAAPPGPGRVLGTLATVDGPARVSVEP